jgi:hypothetical protein
MMWGAVLLLGAARTAAAAVNDAETGGPSLPVGMALASCEYVCVSYCVYACLSV